MDTSSKSENQVLVIIRGAPGHGKSTLAKKISEEFGYDFFEADMELDRIVAEKGEEARLSRFYRDHAFYWRLQMVKKSLSEDKSVVTTGLFIRLETLRNDLSLAEMYGARVEIIDRYKPEHRFVNTRGTSEEKVNEILKEFEPLPTDPDGTFRLRKVKLLP